MTLQPGAILNERYRILSILGQGGMGSVYRAMDLNLSVEVAVKENLYLSEEFTRQFKREAAILASLRHPNLPKVTDHFELPNQGQYLVMEYITGEDLRERMDREGLIPDEDVIRIGAAVCDALTYLHTRNPAVIHRDIKPGNVRIADDGHVLLVDFGLAKIHLGGKHETTTGARAMTPGYSPPEQYGSARTDPRSDIYSLGATLYSALSGAAPEDSLVRATDFTKLTSIRSHNSKVSKKLAEVIERSLELKPDSRYQTAEDMKAALIGVIGLKAASKPITHQGATFSAGLNRMAQEDLKQAISNYSQPFPTKKPRFLPAIIISTIVVLGVVAATTFFALQGKGQAATGLTSIPVIQSTSTLVLDTPVPTQMIIEQVTFPSPKTTPVGISTVEMISRTPIIITPSNDVGPTIFASTPTPLSAVNSPDLSAIRGEIAFTSIRTGAPQIWIMDIESQVMKQITNLKEGACQPDWSPDGLKIVFVSPCMKRDTRYPKSSLFVINRDGSELSSLEAGFGGNYDPAWSPDGMMIAYTKEIQGFTQVYIYNLLNGKISAAVSDSTPSMQPSWAADGYNLAHLRTKYSDQIWISNLISGTDFQLTRSKNLDNSYITWFADGSSLIYTQSSRDEFNPRLMAIIYQTDGKAEEYKFPPGNHPIPSPAGDAEVSPDGNWVIFESWPDGKNHDIYVMSLSGEMVKRMTVDAGIDFQPAWNPAAPNQ